MLFASSPKKKLLVLQTSKQDKKKLIQKIFIKQIRESNKTRNKQKNIP